MKIIYNNFIPFKGFLAINICGIFFIRKDSKRKLNPTDITHERIHTEQMKELGYILFYVLYIIEYLLQLIIYKNTKLAYRNISFEREAYLNQNNLVYLKSRKHYAQWK